MTYPSSPDQVVVPDAEASIERKEGRFLGSGDRAGRGRWLRLLELDREDQQSISVRSDIQNRIEIVTVRA